jgi:anti-sigma B factor antagonist
MALDDPLTIERTAGSAAGVEIIRLTGPVTLRNLWDLQSELRKAPPQRLTILDLSGVPYMDSAGMGAVINHYTHCVGKGTKLIVAGVSSRVLELFKLTCVDSVIPMAATVDEAESRA